MPNVLTKEGNTEAIKKKIQEWAHYQDALRNVENGAPLSFIQV